MKYVFLALLALFSAGPTAAASKPLDTADRGGWVSPGEMRGPLPSPPLPPTTPKRLSEIRRMTPAELGSWLHMSWIGEEVVRTEFEQGRGGPEIWLHDAPRFDAALRVCSLGGWGLRYDRVQQASTSAGDPLLQPTLLENAVKFRTGRTAAECNVVLPYSKWALSYRDDTFASGLRAFREAMAKVRPNGRSRLPIKCEDITTSGLRICDNPGQLLRRFQSVEPLEVWPTLWTKAGPGDVSNAAWTLSFPASSSPDVTYVVTIKGARHPSAVSIQRRFRR